MTNRPLACDLVLLGGSAPRVVVVSGTGLGWWVGNGQGVAAAKTHVSDIADVCAAAPGPATAV